MSHLLKYNMSHLFRLLLGGMYLESLDIKEGEANTVIFIVPDKNGVVDSKVNDKDKLTKV